MAQPPRIDELIVATARQKLAAAQARNAPDLTAERPRAAILHALGLVAEAIADDGFVFSPSRPKFTRRHGDFTFEIAVQSDRNNVAGLRAAVWVHVAIYSRTLTMWRKAHCAELSRVQSRYPVPIFATSLGYLCDPPGWWEWDFVDQAERQMTANDLIHSIRTGAFPLFSKFDGPIDGIAALADHELISIDRILSYLLSVKQGNLADATLRQYLYKCDRRRSQFERLFSQFSKQGLPPYRTNGIQDLAAFAVITGYPWNDGAKAL